MPPSTLRDAAKKGVLKPWSITPGGHYLWHVADLKQQLKISL